MKPNPRGIRKPITASPKPSTTPKVEGKERKPASSGGNSTAPFPLNKLIEIALAEVGVREEGGNNCGPRIREYQAATWLELGPWAWCAAFLDWCIREWLKIKEVVEFLGIKDVEEWRPKTAGAFDYINWARKHGVKILPRTEKGKAGDIVVLDFNGQGHIVLAIKDQDDGLFQTVEGNTNIKGERESEKGDGVWKKTRGTAPIKAIIRFI